MIIFQAWPQMNLMIILVILTISENCFDLKFTTLILKVSNFFAFNRHVEGI